MVIMIGTILTNGRVVMRAVVVRPHYGVVGQLLKRDGTPARRGRWVERTWYGREIYVPMSHIGRHWVEKESA